MGTALRRDLTLILGPVRAGPGTSGRGGISSPSSMTNCARSPSSRIG